ncbi:hypothetical protein Aca07nite_86710 [Actinoplanes capillaceus]|uniref:Prepilin-type N-terminal cleavage/methylation domain-containing protein n=1 Tax=Actinoplanes campanulatus TaxID=113559 RepID=A0ABQ3WYP1_9ACTN|nr:prepilin-type N-terminal cleavage/methylation domain-containing protein [Actinoplanes capillaceus]GID51396.1 hypothetical protein Aca07nite_86710 [Actinoplanes capillaceus]
MRQHTDDKGFSLVELLVTVALMSVVTLVIVGATVQIYSGTKSIDNTAEVRDQLDNSFRRLDRELRYASWISPQGKVGDRWFMEYETKTGCRQLKIENGVLSLAEWTSGTTPGTAAAVASGITLISGVDPFNLLLAGAKPYASASPGTGMGAQYETEFQQVRMRFMVKAGTVALPFESVFTAQNLSRSATGKTSTKECDKGRPTS